MSTPLATFSHTVEIVLKITILVLIQERWKEFFVILHMLAGLFSKECMSRLISIDLISNGSEEAVSIPFYISKFNFQRGDIFVEFLDVLHILLG